MKNNKKNTTTKKHAVVFEKKLEEAKKDYEKIFIEIAPFIPRVEVKEPTTEGKWQTSTGFSLY